MAKYTEQMVKVWMRANMDEFVDNKTGELCATHLAEAALEEFDVEWVSSEEEDAFKFFDWAIDVSDWYDECIRADEAGTRWAESVW